MGYCCFATEDRREEEEIIELDLRAIPPLERHEKILTVWDSLKPGQASKSSMTMTPSHYTISLKQSKKESINGNMNNRGQKCRPLTTLFGIEPVQRLGRIFLSCNGSILA